MLLNKKIIQKKIKYKLKMMNYKINNKLKAYLKTVRYKKVRNMNLSKYNKIMNK